MRRVHELRCGEARLRIAPWLGGRIVALRLDGGAGARDVLVPFPEDAVDLLHWPKGGLYPLVPYSGRIRGAALDGFDVRLRPHPEAAPHTLHGPTHREPWSLITSDATSATLELDRRADEEWPWRIVAWLRISLPDSDRAVVEVGVRNADRRPMPAGIGLHPYIPTEPQAAVAADAGVDWPMDAEGLAGAPGPARPLAGTLPGGAITLFRSGWAGHASAGLPDGGALALRVLSGRLDHLVVHRPADHAYLCLEPASHVPDGFNLEHRGVPGTGSVTLGPGEAMDATVEFRLVEPVGFVHS